MEALCIASKHIALLIRRVARAQRDSGDMQRSGHDAPPKKHRIVDETIGLFCTHALQQLRDHLETLLDHHHRQHGNALVSVGRAHWRLGLSTFACKQHALIGMKGRAHRLDGPAKPLREVVDDFLATCDQLFYDGQRWVHMPVGWKVEKDVFCHVLLFSLQNSHILKFFPYA